MQTLITPTVVVARAFADGEYIAPETVSEAAIVAAGIVMAWAVDRHVLDFMDLHAARLFTGFACGVEFWSFLENAAQLSDAPLFRWLKRYVRRRMRKEAGDV